jgi:choline dehydrogenase
MQSSLIKDYALDPNNYEVYPGVACDTLEKMMLYIKNWQSYGHHMSGTCKMGLKCDPMSVLDSRLKVHGISGLRVIDMSLYPSPFLHAYNPSRGIYMIAEMMSDIIKSEYK